MAVRSRFSERVPVRVDFSSDPGRAKQSMKDECDINVIMKRFERTGVISHINRHSAVYADVSQGLDFRSALEVIKGAESMFMELPATVRKRFGNDPAEFFEYVQDPSNIEELRKLGLANPAREEPPAPPAAEPAQSGSGGNPQ